MTGSEKYFVFIYPAKSKVKSLLDLAIFTLFPREKWPAHVTVAGPFQKKPNSRAVKKFNGTIFSLGTWNFFQQGLNTVYLKVGMTDIRRYWMKPNFIGNPVPHISLYNGEDRNFAEKIFSAISSYPNYFSFDVEGIEVVSSSRQGTTLLRELVDTSCLDITMNMQLDDIINLSDSDRIEIASRAIRECCFLKN